MSTDCAVQVWSELGFSASLLDEGVEQFATSGTHRINISLRKDNIPPVCKNQMRLPSAMVNPPHACPPQNVSAATLASVDISLEYCFHEEQMFRTPDSYGCELQPFQSGVPSVEFELELEAIAEPQLPDPEHGSVWLEEMHCKESARHIKPQAYCTDMGKFDKYSDDLLQLFEFGFQRLIVSKRVRNPEIQVSSEASLSSLPDIAPSIFKSGYRETINQRGVIIPTITKAISDMLQGSHPSLKGRLMESIHPSQSPDKGCSQKDPQAANLRNFIHSRLWDIALDATGKSNPPKNRSLMLSAATLDRDLNSKDSNKHPIPMGQPLYISEKSAARRVEQNAEDENNFASLLNEPDCLSECESQLLDNYSDTSFTDLGESTQTSLDSFLSTAASSQMTWSDDEKMLFSDPNDGATSGEGIAKSLCHVEDMGAWDADLILMEGP
ncbi:uncharacterized protein N7506_009109 [Penicillium brevicompactum]|uniref:uncharacterized protein n=1 Tax=Penicillium brevicompactum TaxID=5074 RepID=UPI002541E1F7|nr:uncharacterized protein N7506_009109 [Penicillium brevicompactum]KAJ5326007.1 hypothetical protein N7506_009109 [Penicillium brevicompactum]